MLLSALFLFREIVNMLQHPEDKEKKILLELSVIHFLYIYYIYLFLNILFVQVMFTALFE